MANNHVKNTIRHQEDAKLDYSEIPLLTFKTAYNETWTSPNPGAKEKPPELSHIIGGSKTVQSLWRDGNILYLDRHLG